MHDGVPKLPNEVTFEAEMNLTCPVHGVRRLGAIHYLTFESDPDAAKLTQLVVVRASSLATLKGWR
jgi:hypothetical protein